MGKVQSHAQACLVATCVEIVLIGDTDENAPMYLGILRDVLPDCAGAPLAMAQIRTSAQRLVDARTARERSAVLVRLGWDLRDYYARACGDRLAAWQHARGLV